MEQKRFRPTRKAFKAFVRANTDIRRQVSKKERDYIFGQMGKHKSMGGVTAREFDREIERDLKQAGDPVSRTNAKLFKQEFLKYLEKSEDTNQSEIDNRPHHDLNSVSGGESRSAISHPPYVGSGSLPSSVHHTVPKVTLPPAPSESEHGRTALQRLSNELNGV